MVQLLPVIDWFLKNGGRYGDSDFLDRFDGNDSWAALEHGDLCEIHFRRLQIFVAGLPNSGAETQIELQYLLDHSRTAGEIGSIDDAIKVLEPMLPEKAHFEIGSSAGTDIFLIRVLSGKDLEPASLEQILPTLNDFAELAMKRISILYTAPKFKRVVKRYGLTSR